MTLRIDSLRGHPKGVFLVAGTEMWERFSYYGISALFVLYLTAPATEGGFGWAAPEAIRLYGIYAGLAFASPVVGGWISSNFWGERRCIAVGGCAIMLGHLLLGGPAYLPAALGAFTGLPIADALRAADVARGLSIDAGAHAALAAAAASHGIGADRLPALALAYRLSAGSFLAGLACVIVGTALIKPTISSIVGKLYAAHDPRRIFGFTLFMAGIWAGAFSANFVAGTLGERVGWHYGFMAAALGMGVGLGAYFLLQARWLQDVGRHADNRGSSRSLRAQFAALSGAERGRLAAILVMCIFTVVFSVGYYQQFGLLHLFVNRSVDRLIAGFEVPASWFLSISTGSFLVFAPVVGAFLSRRERQGRPVDPVTILAWGLGSLAGAYALLLAAIGGESGGHGVSAPFFAAGYMLCGLGDVFIWPPQLALVTRLAPTTMKSFIVGGWYVTVGLGTYLAGVVGEWGSGAGLPVALGSVLGLVAAGILALLLLRPWILARCRGLPGENGPA